MEGELFETLRSDDDLFSGKFGQNLISIVKPGIIKGLHLHRDQTEYTTCLKGNILYLAIKEEEGNTEVWKEIIGEKNRILVKTPPGIWHGYTPLDEKEAIILYTMDRPYDAKNPDTLERATNYFGNIWQV